MTSTLLILAVLFACVSAESTIYDQRQTGKTNVRVEVKDAVIIAMADDEFGGDYDYSYDYSDLTIKPPPFKPSSTKVPLTSMTTSAKPETTVPVTTPAATTTSVRPNSATSSPSMKTTSVPTFNLTQNQIYLEPENSSIIFPSKNPGNGSSDPVKKPHVTRPEQIPVLVLQELLGDRPYDYLPLKSIQNITSGQVRNQVPPVSPQALPRRHCSPGFFLDSQNRCKRIVPKPLRERIHHK